MTSAMINRTDRHRPPRTAANHRLGLAGLCGMSVLAVVGPTLGADAFDGTYTGTRVLTKGEESDRCPAKDDVTVTIHGEALRFTNSRFRNFGMGFDPVRMAHSAKPTLISAGLPCSSVAASLAAFWTPTSPALCANITGI
jgi:hypothetical protein